MEKIVVLTKDDFDQFKQELLTEITAIFDANIKKVKWLRSKDVRELLNISDSTLQTLRINKTIPAYKLDSTWFYKLKEIQEVLERNKIN